MTKEQEIMNFLDKHVFDPILSSPMSSRELKSGVNLTRARMNQRHAAGMVHFFWSAIVGTERSTRFSQMMKDEGFARFEELLDEFKERFNDQWLDS